MYVKQEPFTDFGRDFLVDSQPQSNRTTMHHQFTDDQAYSAETDGFGMVETDERLGVDDREFASTLVSFSIKRKCRGF